LRSVFRPANSRIDYENFIDTKRDSASVEDPILALHDGVLARTDVNSLNTQEDEWKTEQGVLSNSKMSMMSCT
jgi:hypothetical protein